MKKFLSLTLVLVMSIALVSCANQQGAPTSAQSSSAPAPTTPAPTAPAPPAPAPKNPIVLTYGHVDKSPTGIQYMYAEDLNKRFKEATDGLISLKIFPGESIGSSAAMLDMIKVGTLDMFHHNFSTFGNFYAPIGVFNAPYLTYDVAQLYRATNNSSPILQRLNEGLVKEGGVRIIGAWLNGTREVCCKFPAYKPTDLNGHMFRSLPNDLWNAMVAGLGGTPTPIENAEVVSSLMTNVVEATEQTIEGIHKNSYWEVADYILLTDHLMFSLAVGINEKSWQKISPENQKKILTIMDDMNKEYTTEIIPDREAGLLQKIKEAGMKVIDDTNGLDKDAFRKSVLAEVDKKYPDWTPMIKEIQGM